MGDVAACRPGVVVRVADAFRPERSRRVCEVARPITVRGWMAGAGINEFPVPTICLFNGAPLLRGAWCVTLIRPGDVCAFVALPHGGGGGGGGGKSPLRTVLTIAVIVAAAYLGPAIAGAFPEIAAPLANVGLGLGLSPGAAMTFASGVISGAIMMTGTVLLNALVPAPKPQIGGGFSTLGYGSPPAPSPTYSLQGQGNAARLGQAIPCQYGRHRVFPDLITSEPWSEYVGNEQYLYQGHCLGIGEYDIERIQIAETAIDGFEEIDTEVVGPGETITLFDHNVITRPEVSGQELKGTNEQTGDGYVGPFVLNPVDTTANEVGIDVVFARGLYYANDSGGLDSRTVTWVIEARPIDDDDVPTGDGSWTTLGSESHTAATNTAIRMTYGYTLATPGRYEVRARRTDARDTSSRAGHEIRWTGLKAFVDGPDSYPDITLLMVKMRATDNLSQRTARQINVIATRKIPVWDTETEALTEPQASRSIVWAFADIFRSSYGAGLADARLPWSDLAALDAELDARDDHFDGVFDSKTTVWDAATRVARCGRAVPLLQGGIVRVIRDGPQTVPVAMFGPRNIVKGSLKLAWLMPGDDTADAVTVEYFNARTWKPAEITAALADSAAEKPATVTLFGCSDVDHATREGDYMAAANRYRRRTVTFRTEMEGLIPTYGDMIVVTHDMPRWGQGGEVVAWDSEASVLTLSEPIEWTADETHYIGLRARDGSVAGPYACEAGDDVDQVHLLETIGLTPYVGSSEERTYFAFGPGDAWAQMCRVLAVKPRKGGEQVEIVAVAEDDRVHVN